MKTYMRITAAVISLFCSVHGYLWAFGIWEPKHNFLGDGLLLGYMTAISIFIFSFMVEGEGPL